MISATQLDVEGAESEVLKGATKTIQKYRPVIAFEVMLDERGWAAVDLLTSWGYTIYDHKDKVITVNDLKKIKGAGTFNVLALPR